MTESLKDLRFLRNPVFRPLDCSGGQQLDGPQQIKRHQQQIRRDQNKQRTAKVPTHDSSLPLQLPQTALKGRAKATQYLCPESLCLDEANLSVTDETTRTVSTAVAGHRNGRSCPRHPPPRSQAAYPPPKRCTQPALRPSTENPGPQFA